VFDTFLLHLQGNEYFQRKSYLTALREYNVSVLSAPSATEADSMDAEKSQLDTSTSEIDKIKNDNVENTSPETTAKDESGESGPSVEQKPAENGMKEDKGSNKNELALAYANRFRCSSVVSVLPFNFFNVSYSRYCLSVM